MCECCSLLQEKKCILANKLHLIRCCWRCKWIFRLHGMLAASISALPHTCFCSVRWFEILITAFWPPYINRTQGFLAYEVLSGVPSGLQAPCVTQCCSTDTPPPPLHQITPWQGLNQSTHKYTCWRAGARASFSRAFHVPPCLLSRILPYLWQLPYLWDYFMLAHHTEYTHSSLSHPCSCTTTTYMLLVPLFSVNIAVPCQSDPRKCPGNARGGRQAQ